MGGFSLLRAALAGHRSPFTGYRRQQLYGTGVMENSGSQAEAWHTTCEEPQQTKMMAPQGAAQARSNKASTSISRLSRSLSFPAMGIL